MFPLQSNAVKYSIFSFSLLSNDLFASPLVKVDVIDDDEEEVDRGDDDEVTRAGEADLC